MPARPKKATPSWRSARLALHLISMISAWGDPELITGSSASELQRSHAVISSFRAAISAIARR